MDVPNFGTWGEAWNYVLLAFTVTVATPCQGFETQHGLISSCFLLPSLVNSATWQMCTFLYVREEFIFLRKQFMMPEDFLAFLFYFYM